DVFLLSAVAFSLRGKFSQQRFVLLPYLRRQAGTSLCQVNFQPFLLHTIPMLPNHFGLVKGPLIRRLLLGQEHLFHGVVAPEGREGQHDRIHRSGDGYPTREGLVFDLFQLFRIGKFDFRHRFSSSPATASAQGAQLHGRPSYSDSAHTVAVSTTADKSPAPARATLLSAHSTRSSTATSGLPSTQASKSR